MFQEFDTSTYSIFDRQNMLVSLYDEIIDSILHIIDRLDLSVEKEKPNVMRKISSSDFHCKCNLERK